MQLPKTAITTLALLLAGPALAQKVDLRGPAPEAGYTLVTTVDSESEKGELNMNAQGQVMQGEMQTTSHNVIQTKLLEVEAGQATKVETTFVEASTTNKMTIFGQEQNQEDKNMEGLVMTSTKGDDGWETTVEGGDFPPEAAEMLKEASYVDPRLAFPAEPVGVGDSWELEDEELQAFMGQSGIPGSEFEGEIEFELLEIKTVDGNKVAVIQYEMDSAMIMNMSPQGMQMKLRIEMEGEGLIERDLSTYTNAAVFEGDMTFSMDMMANGQPMMQMSAEMPMESSSSQEVK